MSTEALENKETNLDNSAAPEPADSVSTPAASGTDNASGPDLSALAAEYGVDGDTVKEFMDSDDNFAKLVKEAANNSDKSSEDDHAADDKPAEDSAADSETKEKDTKGTEDKNSGAGVNEPVEFADDVIKGFKGEDFGKLSEDSQTALASFYEEAQAKAAKISEYETRLNGLMGDPIIRERATALESGRGADLQVRSMTTQDRTNIINILKSKGFEDGESSEIISALGDGLNLVAQDMAQDMTNRAIVANDAQRQQAEINKQGNEILLSLSQYNEVLAVKEKNVGSFYKQGADGQWGYNESHPEIEKFKNGLGKICSWATGKGIDYRQVVNMGAKALYAAAAADLDMPLVMNAADRDKKIVAQAKQKALAPFLKSAKSGTLNTQSASAEAVKAREKAAQIVHDGFDAERLVTDNGYYSSLMEKYWNDPEKLGRIEALVEKGRQLLVSKK